jgi:hypothetical protein
MKKLVVFIMTIASLSAFGIGGTVDAEWADGCNLSDGSYCYNSSGIYPSGTSLCDTFNNPPGTCTKGSISGTVKKVIKKLESKKSR